MLWFIVDTFFDIQKQYAILVMVWCCRGDMKFF